MIRVLQKVLETIEIACGDRIFYNDGYVDYPGVGKITDKEVADFTMKHLTMFDKLFRPRKVAECALISQVMLMKVIDEPEGKWKF